jgi:murein DD-endopeptidase MepM/ murein hydrolase activator NlpD
MKRTKLLISLIAAAGLTAGFGGSIVPASANRTVTVTLTTGQTLSASGDIPCDASVTGAPANLVASVQCTELPPATVSTPQVTQPPQEQPSQPSQSTPTQSTPTQTSESPQPSGAPQRQPSTVRRPGKPGVPTPSTSLGATRIEDLAGERARRQSRSRSSGGAPTPANPTFSLAVPGPAPIGVPNFFISKFRIPPFLLPIYQAAGIEYGVPWQVLAAINEIETDYGRNLSVSSAGAMGWMQFIPSSWRAYGVDANGDGRKDPYNPVDAIFAAARYLKAAGAEKDVRQAVFSYNHAWWYVDSVMLRAKLIGGLPDALVGAITGLTQGRFPVAARATYADDLSDTQALKRAHQGGNAANVVGGSSTRTGINVYSRVGAPVIAVQDGVIKAVGRSKALGRYLVLQDAFGNRYTYAHLGKVAPTYPAPKPQPVSAAQIRAELELPPKDQPPTQAASAGSQPRDVARGRAARTSQRTVQVTKERLFAHPSRAAALAAGGRQQLLGTGKPVAGFSTFEAYFKSVLGLDRKDVELKPLRVGAQVIGGTVLGRIERTDPRLAPHLHFEVRPAGKGAPAIDPKPVLDGWKLLEATAIYRAAGKNPFFGPNAKNPTIGQILLMSKEQLQQRVLADPRIEIYQCGREDIQSGQIDRRVLATLEYLAAQGLKPTVSALKCGHSYLTKGGAVSEHSYGDAVDIAAVNAIPIIGHQGKGSITDITIKRLLLLQGTMKPHQIISLMTYPGTDNTLSLPDHADHIHVGFYPLYGENAKLSQQLNAVLKPGQWIKLIQRLNEIDNPTVPTKPSKASIPAGRASQAHPGE